MQSDLPRVRAGRRGSMEKPCERDCRAGATTKMSSVNSSAAKATSVSGACACMRASRRGDAAKTTSPGGACACMWAPGRGGTGRQRGKGGVGR